MANRPIVDAEKVASLLKQTSRQLFSRKLSTYGGRAEQDDKKRKLEPIIKALRTDTGREAPPESKL